MCDFFDTGERIVWGRSMEPGQHSTDLTPHGEREGIALSRSTILCLQKKHQLFPTDSTNPKTGRERQCVCVARKGNSYGKGVGS